MHPDQLKKYLAAAIELHKIRRCDAYFLGCSPTELIMIDFGFGEMAICPNCNHDVLLPNEGSIVCNCGIHYVNCAPSRWIYEPQVIFQGRGEWRIESFSTPGQFYTVNPFERECSCPHHVYRAEYCKHLKKAASLTAISILNEINFEPKSDESIALIIAAIRRWFDPRKYNQNITYRELRNDIEKISGIRLTTQRMSRIVSKFEDKNVLERKHSCTFEGKTLIGVNEQTLNHFHYENIQETCPPFSLDEISGDEKPFLKLDSVYNASIMLPQTEFCVYVNVNYRLTKPTDIQLVVQDSESHMVTGSVSVRLNGEDVTSLSLTSKSLGKKLWTPQVQLYSLNDNNEWHLADYYISGRKIFSPEIKTKNSKEGIYEVESFSEEGKFYQVDIIRKRCSCPDYMYNHDLCKHLQVVERIETKQGRADS